ncbi:cation-transporting P-type ATPase [Lyngbya sp. CCY1209]|uniref:cation-translocating P-type ATPase n=1 Tax=Lyngbya sp. CCY1209 TaxID=2886103 RepID=UPI002D1FD7F8|nr:cation-transporting P-type ATPase [Lyngbya sp. CCY1209]MEB3887035.1 cation-transporting P-type ATPase [Lyngbya sp. CCY1209]
MKTVQPTDWHALPTREVIQHLETDPQHGLSARQVMSRQEEYGPNALTERQGESPIVAFLKQFNQPLIYILIAAGIITGLLREWVDMGVIFAVVLINAVVGFVQEEKAVQAMEALAREMQNEATTIRDRQKQRISAAELIPGDLVVLQSGDKVAADLRLLHSRDLQIDESALTGESVPAEKFPAQQLPQDTALGDRDNMAYSSTLVTYGTGTGVVVATGDGTEIGRINEMIASAEMLETPLTRQIEAFSLALMKVILAIAGLTLVVGLLRAETVTLEVVEKTFLEMVALAVGAVPEGLPVVVTITLAIGVSRMATRNAIIRKLPAVETLGSTTTICSDKTGTLTQNEMTVQEILAGTGRFEVSGVGYGCEGKFTGGGRLVDATSDLALMECLKAGFLCNDSRLVSTPEGWRVEGDPTEAALIAVANKIDGSSPPWDDKFPRLDAIPFESQYQYMATLHQTGEGQPPVAYIKGSVERILPRCRDGLDGDGTAIPLDKGAIEEAVGEMADRGLRVLAFARAEFSPATHSLDHDRIADGLTFLGLQGMIDPPRPEAIRAIEVCLRAGIQVKMITGDHVRTATAIGRKIGLDGIDGEGFAVSGQELAKLSDGELRELVERVSVFARVAPEQKLRLVKALQAGDRVVAMTGDGVNDAPALQQADIGIAMGMTGTEVAKEAADMVLTDDNFATIKAAVEEGRRIYDNIIKSIIWLLPTNASLGLIIVIASFFGLEMPATPLQILWINTIAAVLLGTTLAFEVGEPGIMERAPRPPKSPLLRRADVQWIMVVGGILCAAAFWVYHVEQANLETSLEVARTAAVNAIVFGQIFLLFHCRSLRHSMFTLGLFSNRWLLLGVALMVGVQLLFTYLPVMQQLFKTAAIGWDEWGIILSASLLIYLVLELHKWWRQRRKKAKLHR